MLRFVSLLAVAIAHNVLSFPLYFSFPHLLIRFCSCLRVSLSLSISYLSSLLFLSQRATNRSFLFFFVIPSYLLARASNVTRTASEYEFNLAGTVVELLERSIGGAEESYREKERERERED